MIDLETVDFEPAALKLIPKRAALELNIIPIALENDIVIVAVPQMFRRRLLTDVRFILGKKKRVKPVSASRDSIIAAIHRLYGTPEIQQHESDTAAIGPAKSFPQPKERQAVPPLTKHQSLSA